MKFELILMLVLTSTTISCCNDILEVAKPGDNVTLKCVNVSGNISELEWTRDGLAQDKSVFLYKENKVKEGAIDPRVKDRVTWKDPQTADIILKNVTVSDTGTYKCWVYIQDQKSAADDPPDRVVNLMVTDEIYKVMAKPGDTVTLECVSVSGNFIQLQWTRYGLAEDNYVFLYRYNKVDEGVIDPRFKDRVTWKDSQTSDIVLKNVTVNDTGIYKCRFKVEAGDHGGDGGSRDSHVGTVVGVVVGVVVAVVAAVVVFLVVRRKRQRERKEEVVKPGEDVPLTIMPQETSTSQLENTTSAFNDVPLLAKVVVEVEAKRGDDVTLKCVSVSGEISLLEWTRVGLAVDEYVFFYRDNKVNEGVIDQRFQGRVTLKDSKTADIILKNVTVRDTGIYKCWVYGENQHQDGAAVGVDDPPHGVVNLMVTDGEFPDVRLHISK